MPKNESQERKSTNSHQNVARTETNVSVASKIEEPSGKVAGEFSDGEFVITCFVEYGGESAATGGERGCGKSEYMKGPIGDAKNERPLSLHCILWLLATREPQEIVREFQMKVEQLSSHDTEPETPMERLRCIKNYDVQLRKQWKSWRHHSAMSTC